MFELVEQPRILGRKDERTFIVTSIVGDPQKTYMRHRGINLIGSNGVGKTTLLEASRVDIRSHDLEVVAIDTAKLVTAHAQRGAVDNETRSGLHKLDVLGELFNTFPTEAQIYAEQAQFSRNLRDKDFDALVADFSSLVATIPGRRVVLELDDYHTLPDTRFTNFKVLEKFVGNRSRIYPLVVSRQAQRLHHPINDVLATLQLRPLGQVDADQLTSGLATVRETIYAFSLGNPGVTLAIENQLRRFSEEELVGPLGRKLVAEAAFSAYVAVVPELRDDPQLSRFFLLLSPLRNLNWEDIEGVLSNFYPGIKDQNSAMQIIEKLQRTGLFSFKDRSYSFEKDVQGIFRNILAIKDPDDFDSVQRVAIHHYLDIFRKRRHVSSLTELFYHLGGLLEREGEFGDVEFEIRAVVGGLSNREYKPDLKSLSSIPKDAAFVNEFSAKTLAKLGLIINRIKGRLQ